MKGSLFLCYTYLDIQNKQVLRLESTQQMKSQKNDELHQKNYVKRLKELKNGVDDMNSFFKHKDALDYFMRNYTGLWKINEKSFDFDEDFDTKFLVIREGIHQAILSWDSKKASFSTHCTNKIRGSITIHKRTINRLVRVPSAVIDNNTTRISEAAKKANVNNMRFDYSLDEPFEKDYESVIIEKTK